MPEEIQELANQDYILPTDMTELRKITDPIARLKAAGYIRDQRKKGKKGSEVLGRMKRQDRPSTKKHRKKGEIFELQAIIQALQKEFEREGDIPIQRLVSPQGNSIVTRVLAWCAGEISANEVHVAIREYAILGDVVYHMPQFEQE